jgi:ATP-dependent helicase HrpB
MVGGSGVVLTAESVVREAELLVALDLEGGGGPDARVRVASAIEPAWLDTLFPGAVRERRELVFDAARERVVERVRVAYLDLVLAETVRTDVDRAAAGAILADAVDPDQLLGDAERGLLDRLRFLARAMPEVGWPADAGTLARDAVRALAAGRASVAELRAAGLGQTMLGLLTPAQRRALEREAPVEFELPSGRSARIRYQADRPPVVAARIQELFGLTATPRLAAGRVPLVLELLAPNRRPVQITDDLASFWRTTYAEVRKQLRGRYPKHAWPDKPSRAHLVRPRGGRPRE